MEHFGRENEDMEEDHESEKRRLSQIPVPEEFHGLTYSELFCHLLEKNGAVSLGLYRCEGTLQSLVPFVHTNPSGDVVLNHKDLVFVIQ